MKKLGIILFIALISALLVVSVSAKTISFIPLTEGETDYTLTVTKDAGKDNGNWFLDGENYIIYKFPVAARDIYAKFTATIGAQYEIAVSNDNAEYTVIDAAVKPEDATEPSWGADRLSRSYDLSSYLTGENGFIYVRIADAEKENGWGPYIVSSDKIVFTSSYPAGQNHTFKPFTDAEKTYLYEITEGAGNDAGNHFLDGENYLVYRFPVSSKDTYALFTAKIGAQYMVSASKDGVNYKQLEAAVKPEDAEPSWGEDRKPRSYNVSEFLTAYDGYIYIKIEDVDKENGWGPYIVTSAGVSFYTTVPDLPFVSLYHNADNTFSGAGPVALQTNFDAKDLSAYFIDGMAVGVRVYVKGSAGFQDNGQFELTSSGASDANEFHWSSAVNFNVHDGWNILVYPISAGVNESNAVLEAINFIRLYQFSDAEYTFNITDIFIGPQKKVEAQSASPLLYLVKGSTDSFTGAGPVVVQTNFATPFNLSGYLGGGMVVGIRMNVSGSDKFQNNGQFELTSSGTCDAEEVHWGSLVNFNIKDGWNVIMLPVDASEGLDQVNKAAVNFMRLYQFSDAEYTIQISDIVIGPAYAVAGLSVNP